MSRRSRSSHGAAGGDLKEDLPRIVNGGAGIEADEACDDEWTSVWGSVDGGSVCGDGPGAPVGGAIAEERDKRRWFLGTWPVAARFVVSTFVCAIPPFLFVLGFSAIGYGHSSMVLSRDLQSHTRNAGLALSLFALALYLLDVNDWPSRACRYWAYSFLLAGSVTILFLVQSLFPAGPLCAFIALFPLYLVRVVKPMLFLSAPMRDYLVSLTRPLLAVSMATFSVWFAWTITGYGWSWEEQDNEWDVATQIRYAENLGCPANFIDFPQCRDETRYDETGEETTCFDVVDVDTEGSGTSWSFTGNLGSVRHAVVLGDGCASYCVMVYQKCPHAFLVWVNPLLAGVGLSLLSFVCSSLKGLDKSPASSSAPTPFSSGGIGGVTAKSLQLATKAYLALLFVLWCTASLAGAGEGLTSAFVAYTIASLIGVGILIVSVTRFSIHGDGRSDVSSAQLTNSFSPGSKTTPKKIPGLSKLLDTYQSYADIIRGLIVVTLTPVVVVYLILSFVNQCVRKISLFPWSVKVVPGVDSGCSKDWKMWLTARARGYMEEFNLWGDFSRIYRYAVYWGAIYTLLQVMVTQLTVVFLSWLIQKTQNMSLIAVSSTVFLAGLALFLLPPTPGGPIYIAGGIVIVASGRDSIGIFGSVIFCIALSLVLKLFACAMQQVVIGRNLSHFVYTRQVVRVNSQLARTIRLVLSGPGLNTAKVCILVGCPDWPTSVLCGIMQLDLFPVLVGTTPIIFIIVPMVLTGSFAYMAALPPDADGQLEFPTASTLSAISAVVAAMGQFGSMAAAAHYIEKEMQARKLEIEQVPIDSEVQVADEQASYFNHAFSEATKWTDVPNWSKWILKLSVAAMIICCHMLGLFQSKCFRQHDLTYASKGEEITLANDVFNFVTPFGWAALSFFALSCILLSVFMVWAQRKAINLAKSPLQSYFSSKIEASETLPLKLGSLPGNQPNSNGRQDDYGSIS